MGDEAYVGHEKELLLLQEELRPNTPESRTTGPKYQLFHLTGPSGAGKKVFIRRLWNEIAKGEVPRILFTISATDENLTDRILSQAKANRSYLEDAIEEIRDEINGQSKRLADAGKPLPDEARLTLWFDLVEQKLVEDIRNNRDLQLVFALTDFLSLPQPLREAIARGLPRANSPVESRLILTSPNGVRQEEILKLFPERVPISEVPIPPLTLENVEDWLQEKKISVDLAPDIFKRCKGLPGDLENTSNAIQQEQKERLLLLMAEHAIGDASKELQPFLCMTALLTEVNQQTLQILMAPDHAVATMMFLRHCDWPESGWRGNSFVVGQQLRQAFLKFLTGSFKDAYSKVAPAAQEFNRIHEVLPSTKLRESLARLCQFNYFNEQVIRETMPAIAEDVISATKEKPSCFENTGSNLRLKPEARQAAEAYIKLAKITIPPEEKKRITTAWENRRRTIMEQMTTREEKVRRDTETLSALQGQIKKIVSGVDAELDKINRLRRKSHRKSESSKSRAPQSKNLQIGRIAMQVIGTLIIYISILVSSKTSLIYAALGVGLIIGGLFVKGGVLAPVRVPDNAPSVPSADLDKHEKNLHFLNIKRSQLESRQNSIAANIAKEKSALKEFDKQLREPYS